MSLSFFEFSKTNASLPLSIFDMICSMRTPPSISDNQTPSSDLEASSLLLCHFSFLQVLGSLSLGLSKLSFLSLFYLTYLPYACCFIYIGLVFIYFILLFALCMFFYMGSIIIITIIFIIIIFFWCLVLSALSVFFYYY